MIALVALLGAFTWTFLEYVIHRWAGHYKAFRKNPFGVEHIRHHIEGNYFAPSYKKMIIAVVLSALLIWPAMAVAGRVYGVAYVVGLMGFYGVYEIIHRLDHTLPGLGPYGRWSRRHHFYHHFVDARMNHGVTSPIWDFVFGTYRKPGVIKVPAKLCMEWLKDPVTGGIRAEHAQTFVLQGKGG
ncbi:MAG TPA: sterol desaturase family protein [Polyangiaceae bacterium]|nr:sterol desaturase family protein [Polyangiaceae bacterium]